MAEALGFAASIISVASLAIQLGDSARKAWEFWESIEDGPEDIRRVSADLRWLANYLSMLSREFETGTNDRLQEMLAKEALETIKGEIEGLARIITELSRKIAPGQSTWKRKWARVQTVLQESKINKMKDYIHNAMRNLQLLHSSRLQSSLLQMNGKLEFLTTTFGSTVKLNTNRQPLLPEVSAPRIEDLDQPIEQPPALTQGLKSIRMMTTTAIQSINAGLGVLTLSTKSPTYITGDKDGKGTKIIKGKKEFAVNIMFRLLSCRRGFTVNTNETFDSWTFNTIRKRPDESPIFQYSTVGDAHGVQELILRGQASVFDIDGYGWTPLHYACRYGHAELIQLLISKGADVYLKSDFGRTPMDELSRFDEEVEYGQRQNLTTIMNSVLQGSDFDTFNYKSADYYHYTFALFRGLPYESLCLILTEDIKYVSGEQAYFFIHDNLRSIDIFTEKSEDCLTQLLKKYQALRNDGADSPFMLTILQVFIAMWILHDKFRLIYPGENTKLYEQKILKMLELTTDIYLDTWLGTPLDFLARMCPEIIPRWLELVTKARIDLQHYIDYEKKKHPEGIIYQASDICCRLIKIKFLEGEIERPGEEGEEKKGERRRQKKVEDRGNKSFTINVENRCNPLYEHLDPQYRCEATRSREICISQLDETLIDGQGKPKKSLPGTWDAPLKPNRDLCLVYRWATRVGEYVNDVERGDLVLLRPGKELDEEFDGESDEESIEEYEGTNDGEYEEFSEESGEESDKESG